MTDSGSGLSVTLFQDSGIALDASFHCKPLELLALVGPSGSGKTTILRAIAGLHKVSRGSVVCNGEVWFDSARQVRLTPQKRRVGMVFQDYALFPNLSALRNVSTPLTGLSRQGREARARELLALVHLAGLEHRRPSQLSGGQRQRVALARALARNPSVLLLDEPFSAVDQMTRRRLQRELAQLKSALQAPTVLVTHDLEEALLLADRMVVLHRGRTLQTGMPAQVMSCPASAEVARLLDLRNIFRAEVVRHLSASSTTCLRWAGREVEAPYSPGFRLASLVDWVIPPSAVILHRRDRPSRGEKENPVDGEVVELVSLGDTEIVSLRVEEEEQPLTFQLSSHVARRNGVRAGERVRVSLLASGIHLMPRVES